jgi:hypothetical protein
VRLSCSITGPAAAASGVTKRRLCDESRAAIQELADGEIDHNVASISGWTTFADPNKKTVLEECQKHEAVAGSCDEDNYDLLYHGQQVPIVEISKDDVREVDPEGLTVLVEGSEVGPHTIALRIGVVEPAFNVMPQQRIELPTIDLEVTHIGETLRAKLRFGLAHYFLPERLNHVMAGVVARNKR